jgi:hypothetical protein
MAQYFGSKPVFDWNPNGSAESGHDFINQINEQKGNITNKSGEYQQAKATAEGADKQFGDMFNNRQAYSDMYNQAAQQAKVDQREQEYQKNLDAVNATRRAMYVLPSATNANSEVRLSQAQRDAALGRNMAQYQNLYNDNSALAQQAGNMYNTALGVAQNNAGQMLSQQNQDINTALANYQTKLDAANNEYNQLLQERNILRSIYGNMYDDEYKHRMQELQIWADNLQAETARYGEQQANYRAQLAKQMSAYEKYLADKDKANAKNASFQDYVISNRNLNSYDDDISLGDRYAMATDLVNRYNNAMKNNQSQELKNIMNGQVYTDYINWLNS